MKKRILLNTAILLLLALGIGSGALAYEKTDNQEEDSTGKLPIKELRVFSQVFGRIKKDYVEKVDDKELLENAIKGMLSELDPHSAYLDADAFKDLQEGTTGEFGGLGIEVGSEDGFIKVIAPIDDTPAQRAGVKSGDLIIRIDDKSVKDLTLDESVKLMRGKPGTEIELTITRKNEDKPLKIKIVRDVIKVASVKHKVLDNNIGYIRISQFQARTTQDLLKSLSKIKKEIKGDIPALIIDLRSNPGGILNAAVSVSDAFLEDGLIVYTQGASDDSKMEFKAAPDDVLNGAPMVVLVDEGSASASEIVAGALQDHKRAVIMGRKTFGKGSVQTIVPINDKIAIKLTTARYYTPSGRSIQAEGVLPDIELQELNISSAEKKAHASVSEADLEGHLENDGNGNGNGKGKDNKKMTDKKEKSLVEKDYELSAAVNLLKGVILYNESRQ